MTLTTDQMQQIVADEMVGRPPRVTGPEADRFRQRIKSDIERAKREGLVVEITNEWPEINNE